MSGLYGAAWVRSGLVEILTGGVACWMIVCIEVSHMQMHGRMTYHIFFFVPVVVVDVKLASCCGMSSARGTGDLGL